MATTPPGSNTRPISSFAVKATDDQRRRLNAIDPNPLTQSILRKIVPDIVTAGAITQTTARGEVSVPDPAYLRQISGTIAQDTTDATSLQQLLPDMKLLENLLISLIMSPKDLMDGEITYSVDRRQFDLPIAGRMLEVIQEIFTSDYNLKKLAPEMLRQALFRSGSYPALIVPENAVDELINGKQNYSNEAFTERASHIFDSRSGEYASMHFLGAGPKLDKNAQTPPTKTPHSFGIESFRLEDASPQSSQYATCLGEDLAKTVLITDNYNVAKFAPLKEARRQAQVEAVLHPTFVGMESNDNYALGGMQRRRTFGGSAMVQAVRTKDMINRPTVGHPLVMRLPSEAVIPVFIVPEKHLGYFILLDMEGQPISLANRRDIYNDLSTQNNGVGSSTQGASQMIQMAQNLSIGVNPTEAKDPAQMVRIYGQLLEHELKVRLANGIYGESAKIKAPDEVYQVMMARSFKRMQTQILYVPAELLVYVAFDFAENGTGRSLVEQSKIIGSMRAMLTFSGLMASIKNSVSRQRVNIELSENDIDPSKTVARVMDEFTRRRNVTMPFVASDPADMISYLNMAGVEFNVTGKGAPAHKVDVEDKVSNRAKVDQDLSNELRDRQYMAFDLTPEAVLASTGPDFATTVLLQNQTQAKRVMRRQEEFTPHLEKFVRTVSANSAIVLNKLREITLLSLKEEAAKKDPTLHEASDVVDQSASATKAATGSVLPQEPVASKPLFQTEEEKHLAVERIVHAFLNAVRIALPKPDTQTVEAQSNAFDRYSEAVDKALSMIIDPAFLSDATLGAYAGRVDEVKAAYKALLMRQWMQSNGFLPEVEKITALDDRGDPDLDLGKESADYAASVGKGILNYLQTLGPIKEAIKSQSDALTQQFPNADLNAAGGSGFSSSTDTGGMGEDEGLGGSEGEGSDNLDMPEDVGSGEGEEPVPTETEETTSETTTGESTTGKSEEEERAEREEEEEETKDDDLKP